MRLYIFKYAINTISQSRSRSAYRHMNVRRFKFHRVLDHRIDEMNCRRVGREILKSRYVARDDVFVRCGRILDRRFARLRIKTRELSLEDRSRRYAGLHRLAGSRRSSLRRECIERVEYHDAYRMLILGDGNEAGIAHETRR